jgi:hypothetical protein
VLNKLFLASMGLALGIVGCVPCSNEVSEHGLAPRPQYDTQIDACITMKSCVPLCRQVFQLDGSVDVRSCKIELVDPANAHLIVRYYDDNSCAAGDDDSDYGYDDGDGYDSGDDGDDGTYDDGSDDGGDDGDGGDDDGGGDDGGDTGDDGGDTGDDGGGDDGGGDDGWKVGPKHVHVAKANAPTTSQPRK